MPSPKIWQTSEALIADLKGFDWRKEIENGEKTAPDDWQQVIRRAVASNTFRAFRKLPQNPSVVFRSWALEALTRKDHLQTLKLVGSRDEYDDWLNRLVQDFQQSWQAHMGKDVPYGPAYKLPNLLMKYVALRPDLPLNQGRRIIEWLHVPLDSYTIQALRNWFRLPGGVRIPTTATMNFVHDGAMYEAFQSEIRRVAASAAVPPIAFDYLAWDAGNSRTERRA